MSRFLMFCLSLVSHFIGRLMRQILAKIMKIYSDFGVVLSLCRLICALYG